MTGHGDNGVKNGNMSIKHENSDSEDDVPLSMKMKMKTPIKSEPKEENSFKNDKSKRRHSESSASPEPKPKKIKTEKSVEKSSSKKDHKKSKSKPAPSPSSKHDSKPTKGTPKKEKQEEAVWKWWEEKKLEGGAKWRSLEHNGPCFPPEYERLPSYVKFYYDGKEMKLSAEAEEVAGFYGKMLDHDYTSNPVFNKNFFKDWQSVMKEDERKVIKELSKCNFKPMFEYFKDQSEKRKQMTKEEKLVIKDANAALIDQYGFCTLDTHKQRIANFRIEPPGLFRGRGNHPKMGMLKKRVMPNEVTINCSKDSRIPSPPKGHRWKEVKHDPTVTWLACWNENVQGNFKYVMLNASSRLKGEKDWKKYETARQLHKFVDKIRADYRQDFKSKEMRVRQRAVALYFIDKLALRAGNEKDEDEADTVGCCSLRFEHIKLHEKKDDQDYVVEFDFLGKDSIRYQNFVPVVKRVFKNLKLFMKNKSEGDDLFDRLNTSIMNQYLRELMDGLTAKVFRTYNASKTLEEQLELLTDASETVHAKVLAYNRANRAVAILCNHQRAVPKSFEKSMEVLQGKLKEKKDQIKEVKKEAKRAKADYKKTKDPKHKALYERLKKKLNTSNDMLTKLEMQATDKNENKDIALGTSKLNYLDPRISVAWCMKHGVPLEKVYSKTQREKFQWAIDMTTASYKFRDINSDKLTNTLQNSNSGDEEEDDDE